MKIRLMLTALLLLAVMIFAVQNSAMVEIQLFFWQVEFPRSLLIFMMLLVGMVVGWVLKAMVKISKALD